MKKIGKGDGFGSDKPLAEVVIISFERFNDWFETLVYGPFLSVSTTDINVDVDTL